MAQIDKNIDTDTTKEILSDSGTAKGRLPDTVALGDDDSIVIIDQTKLPLETKLIKLKTQDEIYSAIKTLQVRGAPAIGVTAGFALYLAAKEIINTTPDISRDMFIVRLKDARNISHLHVPRPSTFFGHSIKC